MQLANHPEVVQARQLLGELRRKRDEAQRELAAAEADEAGSRVTEMLLKGDDVKAQAELETAALRVMKTRALAAQYGSAVEAQARRLAEVEAEAAAAIGEAARPRHRAVLQGLVDGLRQLQAAVDAQREFSREVRAALGDHTPGWLDQYILPADFVLRLTGVLANWATLSAEYRGQQ
jgi:hypothetical protein